MVENMSYFVADDGKEYDIFGRGGGEKAATEMGLELLGQIPIEPKIRECGDEGEPIVQRAPDSASSQVFVNIARRLDMKIAEIESERAEATQGKGLLNIIRD